MERDKNTSEIRIDPQDSIMDRYYIGRRRQDKVYIKRHRNSPVSICTYNIPILLFIFTHKEFSVMRGARIVPTGSAPLSQLTRNRSSSYSKFDLKKFLILKEKGRRRASLSTTLFYKFNKVIFNQKNCKTIFSDKFSNFKIIIYFFNILMVKVTCRVTSRQPSNVDY